MYKRKVPADRYFDEKEEQDELYGNMPGMSRPELVPVDLNKAFVPFEKDRQENLEYTNQCNQERFGLEKGGI